MAVVTSELRARTHGEVLEPRDEAYQPARTAFNALAIGQPAYILRPTDERDVVAAVRWAADAGLAIGVRGGGHSVAGHSSPEGALLIDLSRWRGIPRRRGHRSARLGLHLGGDVTGDDPAADYRPATGHRRHRDRRPGVPR